MTFEGESPVAAWYEVSGYLIDRGGHSYNVLLSFPCVEGRDEDGLLSHDPRAVLGSNYDRARDVANTIFPQKMWSKSVSRDVFYDQYLRVANRSNGTSWGTYFGRLISFGNQKINQVERVITALTAWNKTYRAALVMHTSSPETDKLRPLGAPCLQYLQFNCPNPKPWTYLPYIGTMTIATKLLAIFMD